MPNVHDNCNPKNCPVNVRIDALEKEFDRHRGTSSDTHREIFDRLSTLEQTKSAQTEKLDSIEGKVDKLTQTVDALAEKPGKRWNELVDKLIYAAALAVVAWLAAGMPGIG